MTPRWSIRWRRSRRELKEIEVDAADALRFGGALDARVSGRARDGYLTLLLRRRLRRLWRRGSILSARADLDRGQYRRVRSYETVKHVGARQHFEARRERGVIAVQLPRLAHDCHCGVVGRSERGEGGG